ncbi:esterase [Mycobacterium hubeiense]|uniref:esterase n=1 Tax=Mycobacterium hubeiense TaxID=1867256 RepID=UPI000C7EE74A|nr:esterase [Mycobacterium sp. QGD 101]
MRIVRLAALVAAGVVGCSGTGSAAAQPACSALGGSVEDQTCHAHLANSTYTLDISFPLGYPDQQALTDYLTQTRDGFINVAEMPDSRGLPYEMEAVAKAYQSDGTESVVFKIFQDVGGVHPQTWYKAFNYDLVKGAPITYDTLFKPDTKPLDVILPVVERELTKQTGIDKPILPGEGRDPVNYQNFALTDDAVIFFFGQGELLPEAAGAVEASVPRNALAPVLAL